MSTGKSDVTGYRQLKDDNQTRSRGYKERLKGAKSWGKKKAKAHLENAVSELTPEAIQEEAEGALEDMLNAYINHYAGLAEAPPEQPETLQGWIDACSENLGGKFQDALDKLLTIEQSMSVEASREWNAKRDATYTGKIGPVQTKLSVNASLEAKLEASMSGQAVLTPTQVRAEFAAAAQVSVTANVSGEATFNYDDIGLEFFLNAQLKAEAGVKLEGAFVIDNDEISVFGAAEAGLSVSGEINGSTKLSINGEELLGAEARLAIEAGARFKVMGGFKYKNGKIELKADLAIVLGVGFSVDFDLSINLAGMQNLYNLLKEKITKTARKMKYLFASKWERRGYSKLVDAKDYTEVFFTSFRKSHKKCVSAGKFDDYETPIRAGMNSANKFLVGKNFVVENAEEAGENINSELERTYGVAMSYNVELDPQNRMSCMLVYISVDIDA